MRLETKAVEWRCDSPKCRHIVIKLADDEYPYGFHGSVYQVNSAGGSDSVEWYACSQAHIKAAVLAVTERGWQ